MRESEQLNVIDRKRQRGIDVEEEAVERLSAWREDAMPENLELLDFYGRYCSGQVSGLSNALNLSDVVAAFDVAGIPAGEREAALVRLRTLHAVVLDNMPKE